MIFTATPLPGRLHHRAGAPRGRARASSPAPGVGASSGRAGSNPDIAQCSISFNKRRGTLRGLHYQAAPHPEAKLVRCTAGPIYDVIVDLRPGSPAFKHHLAVTLDAESRRMLYIPEGVAHGFQTLEDDTEVFYQISEFYSPDYARGIRWNDPAFGIHWPDDERTISPAIAAIRTSQPRD